MGAAAIPLMAAGAANNAIGSYYGAKSEQENLRYQARINDINARMSEKSAEGALIKHEKNVAKFTHKVGQLKSSQRVAMAANGIEIGVGSSRDVLATTDLMKEIDLDTMRNNAVADAWGYRMEGVNYQNAATSARAGAASVNPSGAAISSLISGGGQVAQQWYSMNN